MSKQELSIKIMKYLDKIIFINSKKVNMRDTIVLVGTPRSGTTWLMEILGTIPGYTYLFEPLNPTWSPESFKVGFQSRTCLPYNADWLEGEDYLRNAFNARIFSLLPPYQFKPEMVMRRLVANKLIVKSVRLSRLLPWIAKRFELRKIFFIIRHPCAVVTSQLKTGVCGYHPASPPYIDIFPTRKHVLDEISTIDGLDQALLNKLKNIKTREEILAAVWCLDNYVPLSLPKSLSWIIVTYEKLVKNGENEIIRLFNEIGEENIPKSAFRHLKIPSMLTPWDELKVVTKADEQLSKWKQFLSGKQIERILKVVSDFGLDFYTGNLEPDYENIGVKDNN